LSTLINKSNFIRNLDYRPFFSISGKAALRVSAAFVFPQHRHMRQFQLIFLLFHFFFGSSIAQDFTGEQIFYLYDGSFIKGKMIAVTPDSLVKIRLSNGTEIELPDSLIWQQRRSQSDELLLRDGRKLLKKGVYASIGFHTLTAKRSLNYFNNDKVRWGLGGHYSAGYRFSPALAVGGGVGLDAHEFMLMPVFVEIQGCLVRKNKSGNQTLWFGGARLKRKIPLCYQLQLGWNLPVEEYFRDWEFEKIKGGLLVYPAVGLLFPSRSGTTFRLDFGYKFQEYVWSYQNDWTGTKDRILLKSATLRCGWLF
jgi:hypothetical protein